jgi:hypothetical protein
MSRPAGYSTFVGILAALFLAGCVPPPPLGHYEATPGPSKLGFTRKVVEEAMREALPSAAKCEREDIISFCEFNSGSAGIMLTARAPSSLIMLVTDKQKGPDSAALLEAGAKVFERTDLFGSPPLAVTECLRRASETETDHKDEVSNDSYILSCKEHHHPIYDMVVNVYPNNRF